MEAGTGCPCNLPSGSFDANVSKNITPFLYILSCFADGLFHTFVINVFVEVSSLFTYATAAVVCLHWPHVPPLQAVLVSEPQVLGSAAFQQYMAAFLKLADQDTSAVEPKVHAINVLIAWFRKARLGDVVMLYVADGVRVAFLGFEANVSAVRNAATLLFSTLITVIFGVKRSRDEPQRRCGTCLTAHVFFFRFLSLFHFLLDQLNRAGNHLHHR
ncbi:LOW QUALITY PROTEIN: thyroid adenoma-associated protein homolog [Ixodes scapularis]|uniref:LOW QUALITY PROTEIN: thyroid adenoma-associated protein homolog n=1 Tax=Ixodes scapularis TaxID=6945 RepID=UPI001C38A4B6|nr:LOW QUALITY PROTEIN: thyroid adenoma-associated protein homolog [Ixodes scapularis]